MDTTTTYSVEYLRPSGIFVPVMGLGTIHDPVEAKARLTALVEAHPGNVYRLMRSVVMVEEVSVEEPQMPKARSH